MTAQLRIGQTAEFVGEPDAPEWRCRFRLEGDPGALKDVACVIYTLDRSFEVPVRRVDDPSDGFAFEVTCWGEFDLHAQVIFRGEQSAAQFITLPVSLVMPREEDGPQLGTVPVFERPPLALAVADAVLDGGGLRAAAFAGALEAAAEAGVERWVNVAGSAGGALVAALLAAGYAPQDISRIVLEADMDELFPQKKLGWAMWRSLPFAATEGIVRTEPFRKWLGKRFAESPLGRANPTFADVVRSDTRELSPKSRYRLRVLASDLTRARMLVLPDNLDDYEDASGQPLVPDEFPLIDAVLMSMSLPILFPSYTLHRRGIRHYIVDGGMLSNFPVWLFDNPYPTHPTWGFRIVPDQDDDEQPPSWRTPSNVIGLFRAIIWATQTAAQEIEPARNAARTITIIAPPQSSVRVPSLADARTLHAAGLRAARDFFASRGEYENSLRRGLPDELLGVPAA